MFLPASIGKVHIPHGVCEVCVYVVLLQINSESWRTFQLLVGPCNFYEGTYELSVKI